MAESVFSGRPMEDSVYTEGAAADRMDDSERLAALLFRLARDEVTFGAIESHIRVIEQSYNGKPREMIEFVDSARHLGGWAREAATRILGRT